MASHDPNLQLIDAYLDDQRRLGHSPDTIRMRGAVLRALHRDLPHGLGCTTEDELADWLARPGRSQNTRATYDRALRSCYAWAARTGWISFDPMVEVARHRDADGVARAVTDQELQLLLTRAPQPVQLWATIAAYQGLRCCEIAGLDRDHVTKEQLIVVRGKGGRARVHDTDPYVWAAVQALPAGPVALWRGRRATAYEVSTVANRSFDRLGLPEATMHRLRHWLGVTLQARYRDIRVTQKALGHLSLASTQRYTDATMDQQRAARSMLPRVLG